MRIALGDGRQLGAKWLTPLGQGQETPGVLAQTHPLLISTHPEHTLPGHRLPSYSHAQTVTLS